MKHLANSTILPTSNMPIPPNTPAITFASAKRVSVSTAKDLEQYDHPECSQQFPIKVKRVFRFGHTLEELKVVCVADLQPGNAIKFLHLSPFEINVGTAKFTYVYARVNGFKCVINWSDLSWYRNRPPECPISDAMEQLFCCEHEIGTFESLLHDHVYAVSQFVSLKRPVFNRETGNREMVMKLHEDGSPVIDEDGNVVLEPATIVIQKPLIIRI